MLQGRPNLRCRSPHFRRSGMSGQLTTKTTKMSEVLKPQKNRNTSQGESEVGTPHTRCRFSFADLIHALSPLVNVVPGPALMAKE